MKIVSIVFASAVAMVAIFDRANAAPFKRQTNPEVLYTVVGQVTINHITNPLPNRCNMLEGEAVYVENDIGHPIRLFSDQACKTLVALVNNGAEVKIGDGLNDLVQSFDIVY